MRIPVHTNSCTAHAAARGDHAPESRHTDQAHPEAHPANTLPITGIGSKPPITLMPSPIMASYGVVLVCRYMRRLAAAHQRIPCRHTPSCRHCRSLGLLNSALCNPWLLLKLKAEGFTPEEVLDAVERIVKDPDLANVSGSAIRTLVWHLSAAKSQGFLDQDDTPCKSWLHTALLKSKEGCGVRAGRNICPSAIRTLAQHSLASATKSRYSGGIRSR
ncbi:hypothetical protein EDB83DRAFT_2341177 [Lactarius deliciosus]|nr:hypothetical protein EDB83DRAFT_2341177 [Lactarius deliciosus]